MYIALEKKKTNIIEYVLYMWQVENIVRATGFDIDKIEATVINHMGLNANEKMLAREWYENIIREMKSQNLFEKGNRIDIKETVAELTMLHNTLLKTFQDQRYNMLYNDARGDIFDLMKKQQGTKSEIEACLTALFGVWLLKISKKEIGQATQHSINKITKLLSQLGTNYHSMMNQIVTDLDVN